MFDSCFVISTRAHTSRLILGGEIPAYRYMSPALGGFRQPVIALHTVLSSESST